MIEHPVAPRVRTVIAALAIAGLAAAPRLRAAALSADVGIDKKASPSTVAPGGFITYTITISNSGIDSASGVVMTDKIPKGTKFVSFSTGASGVPCTTPPVGSAGTVTCTFGSDIGVGVSFPFTMVVSVDGTDPAGTIANTALVTSTTPDPDLSNNSSTAETLVASPVPISRGALAFFGLALAAGGLLVLRR